MTRVNPYIHFKDNTREAMEFYKSVFGGKLDINTFGEYHMSSDPSEKDKIMHAMLVTDNGIVIMAADTPSQMPYNPGETIEISLSGEDEAEIKGYWDKLSDGATIIMPLEKSMWGDIFGMLKDKYGIGWLVNINSAKSE